MTRFKLFTYPWSPTQNFTHNLAA